MMLLQQTQAFQKWSQAACRKSPLFLTNVTICYLCKTLKQKEFVGHGNFVKWIENNLDIGRTSAEKYMKLFEYQNKLPESGNLQDAYKQIETIEAQAKLTLEMLTGICFDDCTEINNAMTFFIAPRKRRSGMIAFFYFPTCFYFRSRLELRNE